MNAFFRIIMERTLNNTLRTRPMKIKLTPKEKSTVVREHVGEYFCHIAFGLPVKT